MSGRVIVVGSINVDLVVAVDRLPGPGETVVGGRFERHDGGKGGNQAVAAARLGAPTAFVGAVGRDEFGRQARAALEAEGIDLVGLVTIDDEATGVALILVDANGENSIAVAGGANTALGPEQVEQALARLGPRAGDVVLVGHEIRTDATGAALRLGRAARATTILNPAPLGDLDLATLGLADLLTPNRGELAELARLMAYDGDDHSIEMGESPLAVASAIRARLSIRGILVSLGREGAVLVEPGGSLVLPARAVPAVDSTGAGDTLNGALASGLAAGGSMVDSAARAVLSASLAVTRAGARNGMPTLADLQAAGG
jgi:ribokinase